VSAEVRTLIRDVGSGPALNGELVKLGVDVSQAIVAKYMIRRRRQPSRTWRTFIPGWLRH
jgi:hypothetical protein